MEDGSTYRVGDSNARKTRPRQCRQGNLARRRFLRGCDVHPKLRQRDDAAEEPHPRHFESRRVDASQSGTPTLSTQEASTLAAKLRATLAASVIRQALRLRRVLAGRRPLARLREDLHQLGLPLYPVQ
jgi:hypothetical protein